VDTTPVQFNPTIFVSMNYKIAILFCLDGRTLKFTFPTAAAMTVLAWGILNHEDGYKKGEKFTFF
jgi:hypothetical protein